MSSLEAGSQNELVASVASICLQQPYFTGTEAARVATAFVHDTSAFISASGSPGMFGYVLGKYVIRSDDIQLFEWALATVGILLVSWEGIQRPSATISALVLAAIRLARDVWAKGARLNEHEIRILTILRLNAFGPERIGLTVEELVSVFRRTVPAADDEMVAAILMRLKQYPLANMLERQFVSSDDKGRWRSLV